MKDELHESHRTRISDASSFDEICVLCGATDRLGSWGNLRFECKGSDEKRAEYDARHNQQFTKEG
jgi:hypothetical protein